MAEPPPRRRSPAPWADIPLGLARLVLLHLHAHVDRVRFAAVCRHWRAAATLSPPLPPPPPLLVLSDDGAAHGLPDGKPPFRLPRRFAGYTDASGDWLVFACGDADSCCYLRNALSDATVTLPALSRVRAQYVSRATSLVWLEVEGAKELTVNKILYSSPHLVVALVGVFAKEITRIAVCRPGANSWWSVRVDHCTPQFVDMVFHKGQLDGYKDRLFAIDVSVNQSTGDPSVSEIRQAIFGRNFHGLLTFVHGETMTVKSIYLVESCGELLMVCRTVHGMWRWKRFPTGHEKRTVVATERNEFEVFKADFEKMQWTKVTSIGDNQVLFLRRRCSRSICVSGHEMLGDSIIFMENDDEDRRDWYEEDVMSSCSVYNMKDSKVSPLLPMVSWKRGAVSATWLFP